MDNEKKKKERPAIYSLFPPSFWVYEGEQRNVSFLLEGEGGERVEGRERES